MNARRANRSAGAGEIAQWLLMGVILLVPCVTQGAGFAHNANFIVLAPDQPLAEEVLAKADLFRKQVAEEWLGERLPTSVGRAVIHVELSDSGDSGQTWAIDAPGRKLHQVWLTTSRQRAVSSGLRHEITHVVLATRFPDRLPAWIEEGIASLSDDPQRIETRRRIVNWYARTGNWPRFESLIEAPTILPSEKDRYSVAASLTQYLLSRGDRAEFLRFAITGKEKGWDQALQQHYSLSTVRDLQVAWQAWVSQPVGSYARAGSP